MIDEIHSLLAPAEERLDPDIEAAIVESYDAAKRYISPTYGPTATFRPRNV